MRYIFFAIFLICLYSCENIPNPFEKKEIELPEQQASETPIENESLALIATLDNLTVRNGDSLSAAFVTKVKEGDTLTYMQQHSREWTDLKLRGKYFHEPWLKIRTKSGKTGWVYGGGVQFVSSRRAEAVAQKASLSAQRFLQDTAWQDATPTDWSAAGFDDPFDFKTFLIHFKNRVAADDVEALSKMLAYPVEPIYGKKNFTDNYDDIFDADLKKIVAEQRLDRIFRNAKGAMFGNGEIWFGNTAGGYRIIALNSYAQKVADSRKVDDYRTEFADLEKTYQRPTREANPPKIVVSLKEKAISGELIKFIGNKKETQIIGELEFKYSEGEEKVFERKNGMEVLQRMTFSKKNSGVVELKFDDYENFGVGQKFILLEN